MADHVADDFNRADDSTTLGVTSLASEPWVILSGGVLGTTSTWGIQSNQAYMSAVSGQPLAVIQTLTPEGVVRADIITPHTSLLGGIVARVVDIDNFWYARIDGDNLNFGYWSGGVESSQFSTTGGLYPAGTYTLEISCRGDDIEFRVDGTLMHSVTSSVHNTATDFGLLGSSYLSSEDVRWDDFDLELPQEASVTFTPTVTFIAEAAYVVEPGAITRVHEVAGPEAPDVVDPSIIHPLAITRVHEVAGPVAPLPPELRTVITPEGIERVHLVRGPFIPAAVPDLIPTDEDINGDPAWIPVGDTFVPAALTTSATGDGELLGGNFKVPLNDAGEGELTTNGAPPAEGSTVAFYSHGRQQFVGQVLSTTASEVARSEEIGEVATVTVTGHVTEWQQIVVLPDFGSQATHRLGRPVQDTRYFDWTMNGLGNESFGETAANIIPSKSLDMIEAVEGNYFPLPDVWPDCFARWMWVTDPRGSQPRGWCHFRVPTPISPLDEAIVNVQFWMAAFDYAECWVDGVKILTCDQPGVAQHLELPITRHYHLVAIKAYNAGGKGGVLFSMLPVIDANRYDEPVMNSRDGWKSLAYPTRTFISTPGQVLNRLRFEAARRGAANINGWSFTFGNLVDSAGRPWPRDETITLDVGSSYLDVLRRLAEDRIDFAVEGRTLHAWVKGAGSGRSLSSPWTPEVDLLSRDRNKEARL
jgi:hypothetical protein